MQLLSVKSRQASQSVRGTASQTSRCALSFLDATSYVRQARSAVASCGGLGTAAQLATVHMRRYHIILPQPLQFPPAPIAIGLSSDTWIADEGFGLPGAANCAFRPTKSSLLCFLVCYCTLANSCTLILYRRCSAGTPATTPVTHAASTAQKPRAPAHHGDARLTPSFTSKTVCDAERSKKRTWSSSPSKPKA